MSNNQQSMELTYSSIKHTHVESEHHSMSLAELEHQEVKLNPNHSISYNEDGEPIIHAILPHGIQVATGPYGRCLVATQPFAAGSVLYRAYAMLLDLSAHKNAFWLHLYSPITSQEKQQDGEEEAKLDQPSNAFDNPPIHIFHLDGVHSVKDYMDFNSPVRQTYNFDSFVNHSCNANVYSPAVYRAKNELCFDTIALRDINPGDDLACDYAFFDYDCSGHEITQCDCKAPNCRGEMTGFRHLSLAEKIRIMPMCDDDMINTFFREDPHFVRFKMTIPSQNIHLEISPTQTSLVATKKFEAGDLIYSNEVIQISTSDFLEQTFVFHLTEKDGNISQEYYILLNKDQHFVHRPLYMECHGLDTFTERSTRPNSEQQYENDTTYSIYACDTILPGDKITRGSLNLDEEDSS
jgi:hypothetical protein